MYTYLRTRGLLTNALARQASSNTRAAWVLARLTGNDHSKTRRRVHGGRNRHAPLHPTDPRRA